MTDVRRSIKPKPPTIKQSGSMFDTTKSVVLVRPGDHTAAAPLSVAKATDFTGTKRTIRQYPQNFLKKGIILLGGFYYEHCYVCVRK